MTLQIESLNILAMVVCVVTNMVIGALWYSPVLFGNAWLRLTGKKAEDISKEDANKSMMLGIIPSILITVFLALLVEFVGASTVLDALVVGSLVSIGFIGMSALNLVFFENRSFKLAVLNVGYSFASLNVAAVILTLWT